MKFDRTKAWTAADLDELERRVSAIEAYLEELDEQQTAAAAPVQEATPEERELRALLIPILTAALKSQAGAVPLSAAAAGEERKG